MRGWDDPRMPTITVSLRSTVLHRTDALYRIKVHYTVLCCSIPHHTQLVAQLKLSRSISSDLYAVKYSGDCITLPSVKPIPPSNPSLLQAHPSFKPISNLHHHPSQYFQQLFLPLDHFQIDSALTFSTIFSSLLLFSFFLFYLLRLPSIPLLFDYQSSLHVSTTHALTVQLEATQSISFLSTSI